MRSGVRSDPTTWTDARHRHGYEAERRAMDYLQRHGWAVLAHRFRVGRHDIDLIVRKGDVVAFVEVKQRRTTTFGSVRNAVRWRKRSDLARAAAAWIERHGRPADRYRFDFIGFTGTRIDHQPDAFRLP